MLKLLSEIFGNKKCKKQKKQSLLKQNNKETQNLDLAAATILTTELNTNEPRSTESNETVKSNSGFPDTDSSSSYDSGSVSSVDTSSSSTSFSGGSSGGFGGGDAGGGF
tara:strand:- start:1050 stop:1376 length:327 start_codon:yes stop_codon:yes gene_type:complete